MSQTIEAFVEKWAASGAAERANKEMFLAELCDALDVASAFKGAKKPDIEELLETLSAGRGHFSSA